MAGFPRIIFPRMVLLLICLASAGCGSSDTSDAEMSGETRKTSIALNWYPEMEHGGYVAARENGFFEAESLEVDIIPGGPGAPRQVIADLAIGRIQFAVSNADDVILARAEGLPLVAILAPLATSPRCILVHRESGIQELSQLSNVQLAISESRPFAVWMKEILPMEGVSMVPYNGLTSEFVANPRAAQQGYSFSEPYAAKQKGADPVVLMVSETGFNPYSSVLVTTESVIAENPQLVRDVVQCTQQGWQEYLLAPESVNAALVQMNEHLTEDAATFGATALRELCPDPAIAGFGRMDVSRWQELVRQLEQIQAVPADTVIAENCYSNEFVSTGAVSAGDQAPPPVTE